MNQTVKPWKPQVADIKATNVYAFMKSQGIKQYDDLIKRALTGVEWFWTAATQACNIAWFEPFTETWDTSQGPLQTKWFLGGRINITYNCVDRHAADPKRENLVAVIFQSEDGKVSKMTYADLSVSVNKVANYLRQIGVVRGDRVGVCLPMIPELVSVFFAALKIGAVVVPLDPHWNPKHITRLSLHAGVKVLYIPDKMIQKGRWHPFKTQLDSCFSGQTQIPKCVVIQREPTKPCILEVGRDVIFSETVSTQSSQSVMMELPSEYPAMIVYKNPAEHHIPLGAIHTHAGVLAEIAKEYWFHFDLKPKNVFLNTSDWASVMSISSLIGVLHHGATWVVGDGDLTYPQMERIPRLAAQMAVTHLSLDSGLACQFVAKKTKAKIMSLRWLGSGGTCLEQKESSWIYEQWGQARVPFFNIHFDETLMGATFLPLPIREISHFSSQGPSLGMALQVVNDAGTKVPLGSEGFLVCRLPVPSMAKGFLKNAECFIERYYTRFKNMWHDDVWASCAPDGEWKVIGHAADTVKMMGRRVSLTEIEAQLKKHPLVCDACGLGVSHGMTEENLVAFIVLSKAMGLSEFLVNDLRSSLHSLFGGVAQPRLIHAVNVLPRHENGELCRDLIKNKYLGLAVEGTLTEAVGIKIKEALKAIPMLTHEGVLGPTN